MNLRPPSPLYNPGGASDDDFLSGFVARKELLELLLNGLRNVARGGASEHQLIVGQRGMGKSSLLRAIAVRIKSDAKLRAAFAPLQFREEQYNVNALDAFWRNCGEALAQWCEDNGMAESAARLDRAIESAAWRDAETAADAFLAACAETGKRALLLLDNLDLVLGALEPAEHWALRRVLQTTEGPLVVGASTHFLRESSDREAAFYEFFHPHVLEPLDEAELTRCLRALADRAGEAGDAVKSILEQEPGRIRALYGLTGGNPRVLVMTYQLLERRETSDVFADLEALLDKVSPYYKARVEDYATAQQRSVIDAIALNWDPILSHDLSVKAGVEITTVSSHLNRLKRDGFIEEVATSGARAGYQIAERFLNIWYLMRHSTRRTRQRLAGLAAFFARLYSAPELERMAGLARDEEASSHWSPHYREGLLEAARLYGGTPVGEEPSAATASDGVIEGILARARGWTNKEAARLLAHALGLVSRGEHQLALERWEEILSRYGASPDTSLKELAGMAIFGRGVALSVLGRYEEAIIAYDALDARFGGEHAFHKPIAVALFSKGVMLDHLGESEEAIAVYDDVVARFSAASEPAQRERVAMALVHKGVTLGRLGRAKEEIAVYDDAVARFGAASEPALCEWVAKALCNKGFALGELERPKEAIAVYDDVVARFGAASETALREPVAMALVNKGVTLGRLGRPEEEIAAYDDAVGRFGAASEPALREHVGRAVINKGSRFAEQGRSEEAIAVYEDLVARFGAASEPALRERVARALVDKGVTLGRLGRLEEAIAVYDDVVSRFGAASEPALRGRVAMALVSKGDALGKLGRPEDQIAVYDEVVARFGDDSELAVRRPVAWGLVRRGNLALDRRGGFGVAEGAYRRAVALDSESLEARANLAWLLIATGRTDEASTLRGELSTLPPAGLALLDAALGLAKDNFGAATAPLAKAFELGLASAGWDFFDDLLCLLRLAEARGHGERLIGWFESSGFDVKYAPIHAAFVAYVRGERFLRDVNPEVRRAAQGFYDKLSSLRRHSGGEPAQKPKRGRKRKA